MLRDDTQIILSDPFHVQIATLISLYLFKVIVLMVFYLFIFVMNSVGGVALHSGFKSQICTYWLLKPALWLNEKKKKKRSNSSVTLVIKSYQNACPISLHVKGN